jgi:glycosyltransferase involved in cell wall biosynthesis
MRVAFGMMGGDFWTGGMSYLENLLSAICDSPSAGVEPILVVGSDVDSKRVDRLARFLPTPVVVSPAWNRGARNRILRVVPSYLLQRDVLAERVFRSARVDVAFQHGAWFGTAFAIPTLAWIADLQHRRHPEMFSRVDRLRRDVGYGLLARYASRIMVSSNDAKQDCEAFFSNSRGRVDAVPFAVSIGRGTDDALLEEVRTAHNLPERFIFLPNQLWLHKNHLGVIAALQSLAVRGQRVCVVACGNPRDYRHPDHPGKVLRLIREMALGQNLRFLGLVPGDHVLPLMRLSCAVINPSFHEGWSTTVEEAKALGVPLLLSDIPIHREQADGLSGRFFDPADPESIAGALEDAWRTLEPGPRFESETRARRLNVERRVLFAQSFALAARRAMDAHPRR